MLFAGPVTLLARLRAEEEEQIALTKRREFEADRAIKRARLKALAPPQPSPPQILPIVPETAQPATATDSAEESVAASEQTPTDAVAADLTKHRGSIEARVERCREQVIITIPGGETTHHASNEQLLSSLESPSALGPIRTQTKSEGDT
jgi:hypothetical protein